MQVGETVMHQWEETTLRRRQGIVNDVVLMAPVSGVMAFISAAAWW
jgi:hypothetical protein